MGQYVAMGLAYEMRIYLDDMRRKKISKEELRQEIEKSLLFDMNLYDETETSEYLLFTLKEQVLETGLIPFLEAIYPVIYDKRNNGSYHDVLKQLRSTPSAKWIDLAQNGGSTAFQFDKYAEPCCIRFSKDFCLSICLKFNHIMLYLGDGKIITEGINDFTDFFKYCIHETFKEHPVVKSIQVYITG